MSILACSKSPAKPSIASWRVLSPLAISSPSLAISSPSFLIVSFTNASKVSLTSSNSELISAISELISAISELIPAITPSALVSFSNSAFKPETSVCNWPISLIALASSSFTEVRSRRSLSLSSAATASRRALWPLFFK